MVGHKHDLSSGILHIQLPGQIKTVQLRHLPVQKHKTEAMDLTVSAQRFSIPIQIERNILFSQLLCTFAEGLHRLPEIIWL